MKKLYFFGKIIFILLVLPSCDCLVNNLEKDFKETKYIITGKVVQLLDTKDERSNYIVIIPSKDDSWADSYSHRVKVKIIECFKGKFKKEKVIEIGSDFSNCSIRYENNKKYLLFLEKKGNKYFQKHCTRSAIVNDEMKTIKKLQLLKSNSK